MTINLNRKPYWDDYEESKGFYSVLFRPGYAVQTRELNQLQTILQKQVERLGDHVFREGSIVLGGGIDFENDIPYVIVNSVSPTSDVLADFVGKELEGATSGIKAIVRFYDLDEDTGNYVLFVRYKSSSTSTEVFLPGETLNLNDGDPSTSYLATVFSSNPTGIGSICSVDEGALFSKGYFIGFNAQKIVVSKYSATPNATIGFDITDTVVTSDDDSSLFDNAQGTYNYAAPGAHRLKLGAALTSVDLGEKESNPNFIGVLNIQNGIIESSSERTQYSRLYEEIAKRTYDESGDYYVRGFGVRTREHLDTGANEGYLTAAEGGDSTKLSIDIEPGLAYVKGYEVNHLVTKHVITDKSIDYEFVNSGIITARTGGYIEINEAVGSPILDTGAEIELYDTAENRVTNSTRNTITPTGTLLGTAKVKSMIYDSGDEGTANAKYRLYLFDYDLDVDVSAVRSVYYDGGSIGIPFFADTVLNTSGVTEEKGLTDNDLIFPINTDHIRSLLDNAGNADTSFVFHRTAQSSLNFDSGNGEISISVSTINENLPYSDGILSTSEMEDFIITIAEDQDLELPGTGATGAPDTKLIGTSTSFTNLKVGDRLKIEEGGAIRLRRVTNIVSDTEVDLDSSIGYSFTSATISRAFISGDNIDLTRKGSAGITRTATVSGNGTNVSIAMGEDVTAASTSGAIDILVNYKVFRTSAGEVEKKLRPSRLVLIDCTAPGFDLTGPINLGFSDVWQIRSIRKDTTPFATTNQGTDVTNQFAFDNGQRDNLYTHGSITPLTPLTASDYLLVELDYFEPIFDGDFGYFSVDSYPVDDTTSSSTTIFTYEIPKYTNTVGTIYDLRNVMDFRPVVQNTANDATSLTGAVTPSTNPGESSQFVSDTNGLRIAAPSSRINADYSYYLARRDVVTLDKDGQFSIVRGESATSPVTPKSPDNVMGIANVYIPPYPSISGTLGRILGRRDIACTTKKVANIRHTQRDIGVLKQRIENLEYYNALSLLEKNTADLQILDETGLDRFKNGFFTDGFFDHTLGDTTNLDYNISVDKVEKSMRPVFEMDSFKFEYIDTASSGVTNKNNLMMLPYTEEPMVEQLNVTTTRNIEQSVFRYIGNLQLSPDTDVWVDTSTVDKTVEFGNNLDEQIGKTYMNTEWGSWETYATGYNVYRQSGSWSGLKFVDGKVKADADKVGTFNSYADAKKAARAQASYNGYIEGVLEPFDEQIRTGIQTTVTYEKEMQEIGNFVTDVSLVPYIRPQEITLYAQGLKANTRYYVFFDGEDMSQYVSPYVIPATGISDATTLNAEGSELRSDQFGEIYAILRLPASGKRFRVGNKEVVITDSRTNDPETTSYATRYFYASGVDVQKQNTILSTRTAVVENDTITATRNRIAQNVKRVGPSCMAYSFKVDAPPESEGVFLSSVDVFIESMHPELGVWFEIREMDSGGGITRTQVPYSEVWMKRDDPRIQFWNGTGTPIATNVNFESPVFLYNDTQYAFVIHTEGLNPDTYFWVSRLGETDVVTGEPVTARQLTGTLFTTNNNLNYDMVPDLDMMIRFNRAKFDTSGSTSTSSGVVKLGNAPYEFMTMANASGDFTLIGEEIRGSDKLSFSGLTGADTIVVGDSIIGDTTNVVGEVVSVDGTDYYTTGLGFTQSETFTVQDSGGTVKDRVGTIASVDYGIGYLKSYAGDDNRMDLSGSNGKFFTGGVVRGKQSTQTAEISTFNEYLYSVTNLKPDSITFNQGSATFLKRGYKAGSSSFSNYIPGNADGTSGFDEEMRILSRSVEVDTLAPDARSSEIEVRFDSTDEYTTPILDLSRAHAVYVQNQINSDITDEDKPTGGNLINKYISKVVTLAEDQDAEDLTVFLSMYRPPVGNSDVKVWFRARHREDGENISDKGWIEMVNQNNDFSSLTNENNFIEGRFEIPESFKDTTGVFEYTRNGITYKGYRQFVIKIGLLGEDSAVVPRVADLRAIALQV